MSSGPADGPTHERPSLKVLAGPEAGPIPAGRTGQDAGAPACVTRRAGAQRRTAKPLTRAGVEATRPAGAELATAGWRGRRSGPAGDLGTAGAAGVRRGRAAPPRQPDVQHRVGWFMTLTGHEPGLRCPLIVHATAFSLRRPDRLVDARDLSSLADLARRPSLLDPSSSRCRGQGELCSAGSAMGGCGRCLSGEACERVVHEPAGCSGDRDAFFDRGMILWLTGPCSGWTPAFVLYPQATGPDNIATVANLRSRPSRRLHRVNAGPIPGYRQNLPRKSAIRSTHVLNRAFAGTHDSVS